MDMSSRLAAEASYHEHLEKDARNEDILTKAFQQTDFLFSLPASTIAAVGGSSRCLCSSSSSSSSSAYFSHSRCPRASSSSSCCHFHHHQQHGYFQYPSYQLKSFSCTDEETPCQHGSCCTRPPPCCLVSSSCGSHHQQTERKCPHPRVHSPRKKALSRPQQALPPGAECCGCCSSIYPCSAAHPANATPGETREISTSSPAGHSSPLQQDRGDGGGGGGGLLLSSSSSSCHHKEGTVGPGSSSSYSCCCACSHLKTPPGIDHQTPSLPNASGGGGGGASAHPGVSTCSCCCCSYCRQQEPYHQSGGGAMSTASTIQQERGCYMYSDSDRDIMMAGGIHCRGVCTACASSSSSSSSSQRGMMCRTSASSPPTTHACSHSSSSSPPLFGAPKLERKMTGLTSECSTTAPRATTEGGGNEGSGTTATAGGRSTSSKKKAAATLYVSDTGACSSSSSSSVKGGEGEHEEDVEEGGRGGGGAAGDLAVLYRDEGEMKGQEKTPPAHLEGASSHGGGKKNERKMMMVRKKLLLGGGGGGGADHRNKKHAIDVDWDREEDDLEERGVARGGRGEEEDDDDVEQEDRHHHHHRLGRTRLHSRKRSSRFSLRGGGVGGRGSSSPWCSSCAPSCLFAWKKSQGGCRAGKPQQHLLHRPVHAPPEARGHEGMEEERQKHLSKRTGSTEFAKKGGEQNIDEDHDIHHHGHLQQHGREEEEVERTEKFKQVACLNLSHLHPLDILQHPAVLDALEVCLLLLSPASLSLPFCYRSKKA